VRASSPSVPGFPPDFSWGVSTSAYQIEGGMALDGGGRSIWDTFAGLPGRVRGGVGGQVAADHRRRMADDVALIADLGVTAYRFSVSWPRVQPGGRGPANPRGLDFYDALVDALHAHGIDPVVTLYHWDLPQELEDAGGWPARDTASRFADYAGLVAGRIGDRVARWSTINEPWCSAVLGYSAGIHAPGRTDPAAAMAAAHHLLLAHGLGVAALRDTAGLNGAVGLTLNPYPVIAAGERPEDLDAARRVDGLANRFWYDAVLRGAYPDDVLADLDPLGFAGHVRDGDLAEIARPIDAIGLNYYRRHHVRHGPDASAATALWPGSPDVDHVDPPGPHTSLGWAVEPDGLEEVLVAAAAYGPTPLHVDENGAAFADGEPVVGVVPDPARLRYVMDHIEATRRARARGVDVRGYFVWSLLDNFEWAEGYEPRFGIVHVDFATQARTLKASGHWYRELLRGPAGAPPQDVSADPAVEPH
jgi:beta-glucosidase